MYRALISMLSMNYSCKVKSLALMYSNRLKRTDPDIMIGLYFNPDTFTIAAIKFNSCSLRKKIIKRKSRDLKMLKKSWLKRESEDDRQKHPGEQLKEQEEGPNR